MQKTKNILALVLVSCLFILTAGCGQKVPDTLNAHFNVLYLADFPQEYLDAPEENAEQIEAFGLSDFAATFADPAAFKTYNVEISVSNANDYPVSMLGLKVDETKIGKDGVYFSPYEGNVTMGMPAHFTGSQTIYCKVIADKALSMEDVLKTLGKMNIRCVYVDSATGVEDLVEANEEDLMESPITYAG